MKYFLLIASLLILPFTLFASQDDIFKSKGTTQDVIVQLMPSPAQEDVSAYTKIEASFNIPLDVKHVKKYDVKLKCLSCTKKNNIEGTVDYIEADKKVTFTPKETLNPGMYEVEFKSLKADEAHKKTKIKEIKYRFLVIKEILESIIVTPNSLNLTEGETQQLTAIGHYNNGTQNNIISLVEWIVGNIQTISVDTHGVATTLHAGNTTVKAKLGEVVSNDVSVEVMIPDVVAPVITLNGEKVVTVFKGVSYEELGATAIDDRDGDVNVTIAGNVDTSTEGTYTITYTATDKAGNMATVTRTINVVTPTLTSLSVESNVTTLNVGETAEIPVMATYSDGSSKELDVNVEYIITPVDSVDVNGSVLTAKRDADVTVQVKVGNTLSNTLNFTITWVVNGHVLPLEPDKTVNDSTLLGIDSNDNGVRDDVERWIYEEYKDKHPIYIDIAMQAARGYKLVLETPERAKEIHDEVNKATYCQLYYKLNAKYFNEPILIQENAIDEYFRSKIYFNTKERYDAYIQYDTLLSGDSYTLPKFKERKAMCDFDTSKYEK